MASKIDKKFLSNSKQIMDDSPEHRENLKKVMGRVADTIVKKKYVNNSKKDDADKGSGDVEST